MAIITKPKDIPAELNFIKGQLREITWGCCVYFLLNDGQIVYIGSSANVGERMSQHRKTKTFDKVIYVEVEGKDAHFKMSILEHILIKMLKPALNVRSNTDRDSNYCQRYTGTKDETLFVQSIKDAFVMTGVKSGYERRIATDEECDAFWRNNREKRQTSIYASSHCYY